MAAPMKAGMPKDLDLIGTYTIRLTAVDPTTGAVVSGVKVSSMVLTVAPGVDTVPTDLATGDWKLVPGPGA